MVAILNENRYVFIQISLKVVRINNKRALIKNGGLVANGWQVNQDARRLVVSLSHNELKRQFENSVDGLASYGTKASAGAVKTNV